MLAQFLIHQAADCSCVKSFLRAVRATVGALAVSAGAGGTTGATAAVWKYENIKYYSVQSV